MTRPGSFDRVARPYELLERLTFGHALQRTRLYFLPQLLDARHALVLGDGDGHSLAALLCINPRLHATAIDASPVMLALLRRRCAFAADRLRTICADGCLAAPILRPATPFDLVSTHFFLDCLSTPDLTRLAADLRPHLAPGARWILSDFRVPPRGLVRFAARTLIAGLYLAFRLLTGLRTRALPDHATALERTGFVLRRQHLALAGILTAEVWQLVHPSLEAGTRRSECSPRTEQP